MKLIQSQVQQLSQQQLQGVELLQMSTLELEAYVRELALNNPMVEPEEDFSSQETVRDDDLLDKLRWLNENDRQNRFYQNFDADELDPLARIGTEGGLEESLFRFLSRQIHQLELREEDAQTVRYLAACLDDNGYFRIPLEELSQNLGISVRRLEKGLEVLRTLEPAGVGASSLSQCLALQLERIGEYGPALQIVQNHLEELAKHHYRAIANKLGLQPEQVQAAERIIRELDPRPGSLFQKPEQVPYIVPDIFVVEEDGALEIRTRKGERPFFQLSRYYCDLLANSEDREVKEYLSAKLKQAENILWAIGQRETTLQRCAKEILQRQIDFFQVGPSALQPLRMADVAEALGVHESTISRTVREKYLQCSQGVYPLNYFFSRSATSEHGETVVGGTAARMMLRSLIEKEDKRHPLSDQKLSELMAQQNCPISRRTVAKYREEMNLPGASGRRAQAYAGEEK
ncbi:RNA polymerase factor sigma-54 [Flavonifractor sp. An100]|uniref:RNA polymerase factor sigma-54 n=1 Tax=Flavonifractor sp. An100 TaxID=1965538 RepID=UPI000B3760D2|nr:RNA polymerase factor sigma-54 [Flavonifractor sp. An100]OUQ81678.1 RNA polymerase sigma-54 factor [Flavonifractor sp. An100]